MTTYSEWLEEQEREAPPLNPSAVDPDEDEGDDIDDSEGETEDEDVDESSDDAELGSEDAAEGGSEETNMSALRKMLLDEAAEDSEAGRRAKKALLAYDAPEDDPTEGQEEPAADEQAQSPAEKPEGEEEPEPESAEDDKETGKAVARVESKMRRLESTVAKLSEKDERSKLLASRADLSTETEAFLAKQPISVVRDACKSPSDGGLPLGPGKGGQVAAARAAIGAAPTVPGSSPGATPGEYSNLSGHGAMIAAQLGLTPKESTIKNAGCRLSLGAMTPEHARAINGRLPEGR